MLWLRSDSILLKFRMKEKTILIDNLKVNYKIAGSGPAIINLHGWGSSSESWLKIQEVLAKRGYFVVCPDLPGFGKSETPLNPWTVNDYVKWLNNFIEEVKKFSSQPIEPFFLLGHSFGGRIAVRLAADYPEKIKKLILCDPAGIKTKPGIKTKITLFTASVGDIIFSLKPLTRFKDIARNLFYMFLSNRDYVKANTIMKETIKKVLEEDLSPDLPKIETKTLIIWGKKDRIVSVEHAHVFKEKIKNSELKILPKVGHSPHLEMPEKLVEILFPFLQS